MKPNVFLYLCLPFLFLKTEPKAHWFSLTDWPLTCLDVCSTGAGQGWDHSVCCGTWLFMWLLGSTSGPQAFSTSILLREAAPCVAAFIELSALPLTGLSSLMQSESGNACTALCDCLHTPSDGESSASLLLPPSFLGVLLSSWSLLYQLLFQSR